MPGKPLPKLIKTRPCAVEFTLCLPGSPKVNAGGAGGAWLPGRELLRISAFCDRIEGTGGPFRLEASTQPGMTETSFVPEPAMFLRATCDELVQCMVQDASTDRCDR